MLSTFANLPGLWSLLQAVLWWCKNLQPSHDIFGRGRRETPSCSEGQNHPPHSNFVKVGNTVIVLHTLKGGSIQIRKATRKERVVFFNVMIWGANFIIGEGEPDMIFEPLELALEHTQIILTFIPIDIYMQNWANYVEYVFNMVFQILFIIELLTSDLIRTELKYPLSYFLDIPKFWCRINY